MRWWLLVTVAAVALSACTDAAIIDADPDIEGETAGNTALFCRAWPEARQTVVDMFEGGDQRFDYADPALAIDRTMEAYDRAAPLVIRAEWDRVYAAYTRTSDLNFTTGFGGGVVRPVHLTMAYGAGGPEAAFGDAMLAAAAIDKWAVTACGDFCSRWPELEDAVRLDGEHSIIHGGPDEVERRIAQMEAAIRAGNMLV